MSPLLIVYVASLTFCAIRFFNGSIDWMDPNALRVVDAPPDEWIWMNHVLPSSFWLWVGLVIFGAVPVGTALSHSRAKALTRWLEDHAAAGESPDVPVTVTIESATVEPGLQEEQRGFRVRVAGSMVSDGESPEWTVRLRGPDGHYIRSRLPEESGGSGEFRAGGRGPSRPGLGGPFSLDGFVKMADAAIPDGVDRVALTVELLVGLSGVVLYERDLVVEFKPSVFS